MTGQAWRRARFVAGVLMSAGGLYLVFIGIDWPALGAALGRVRLGWLLAAIVVEMVTLWVNAIRWRWIFWPHPQPAVGRLFGILGVAQLANTVLPGRLGLPLRAVLAGEGPSTSRATALTTLAVEKLLEGATLLPIGLVLLFVIDLPDWLRAATALSGGLVLALLLIVTSGLRWREPLLALAARWLPAWLSGVAVALFDGLDSLRSAKAGWRLWGWSFVYWLAVAAVNALVIEAVGIDVPLLASLVLLFVLQVGVRLPSTPANLGIFEYLGTVSLGLFGIEKTPALGTMLLLHLVFYLPPSLLGVGYLLWTSMGLGQLRRAALAMREP